MTISQHTELDLLLHCSLNGTLEIAGLFDDKGPFINTCKGRPEAKIFQSENFSGPPFFAKENRRQLYKKLYMTQFSGVKLA